MFLTTPDREDTMLCEICLTLFLFVDSMVLLWWRRLVRVVEETTAVSSEFFEY
jgi:hypothetical protein